MLNKSLGMIIIIIPFQIFVVYPVGIAPTPPVRAVVGVKHPGSTVAGI